MRNNDLEKKILEHINHSGFPLELEIIEKLRFSNNLVFSNISFQTEDNNIKELDIVALLQCEDYEWELGPVGISLLLECKKTAKYPWVFFEQVYDPLDGMGLLAKADTNSDFLDDKGLLNPLTGCMNTILASHHYNDNSIPKSRTYFEFGKKDNEPTSIYKSVINIFHGRKYLSDWFFQTGRFNKSKGRTHLREYGIVIDGELVLARRGKDGFLVEEVDHVILVTTDTIATPTDQLTGNEILIDVITRNHFDNYQRLLQREVKDFANHLSTIYRAGLVKPAQIINF